MIVYGTGSGISVLGEAGEHQCPACGQPSLFSAIVQYNYAHIWYLLSFLTKKEYFIRCGNCGHAIKVDAKATRAQFPKDNIPFIRKRGWMLVLGAAAAFVAYGGMVSARNNRARQEQTRTFAADPRKNDVYLANLALIEGSGFDPARTNNKAFGTMKIIGIEGDGAGDDPVTFATSYTAYDSAPDLRQILQKRPRDLKYDTDEPVYLTRQEIRELLEEGVILEVRR